MNTDKRRAIVAEVRHKVADAKTALDELSIKLHESGRAERELADTVSDEATRLGDILREFDRVINPK